VTERVRAVWLDARAELLSEHESVAVRREVCCLLLLVGAHRARGLLSRGVFRAIVDQSAT